MTKSEDVRRMIVKYGNAPRYEGNKMVANRVICEGCHEMIQSDGDLSDVEYVKTKRGSVLFFHGQCLWKIWGASQV